MERSNDHRDRFPAHHNPQTTDNEMNSTTELPVIAPTVAVPGLVIHPSIPADLASEMLGVADHLAQNPKAYRGTIYRVADGCGCICAHLVPGMDGEDVPQARWPVHKAALATIYWEANEHEKEAKQDHHWAIARITRFLETAT